MPDEKLPDSYYSPNIIQVDTSQRMKWTRLVAPKEETKLYTWFWWEKHEGKTQVLVEGCH
jgi:hypothetical protein